MSTISLTGTINLILHDREPDCDGVGYSWRRVTVPTWLGSLVLKTQEEAAQQKRYLDEANADMLDMFRNKEREWSKGEADPIVENIRRLDIVSKRAAIRADALHDALTEYLIDSEQGDASCSHILNLGECMEFAQHLKDEDDRREAEGRHRFEEKYWKDEGYHSVFHAR